MKTRLLAAVLAVTAIFGAGRAAAGDGNSTAGNLQGEALEIFQMPMSTITVTTVVSSSATATTTSVTITHTIYWFQVFVVRNLGTNTVADSTTGFLVLSLSGTWTGGLAHDGVTMWVNGARGVPFGLYGAGRLGADDELLRVGEYSEGMTGQPIRLVSPTFHIHTPQTIQAGLNGATVVIRYGRTPYGVNSGLRERRGASAGPGDVQEFYVSLPLGAPVAARNGG